VAVRSAALRDERRELADECGVASNRKVGLDPLLEHGEPAVLEARAISVRAKSS
jgi:hypothetical protein